MTEEAPPVTAEPSVPDNAVVLVFEASGTVGQGTAENLVQSSDVSEELS